MRFQRLEFARRDGERQRVQRAALGDEWTLDRITEHITAPLPAAHRERLRGFATTDEAVSRYKKRRFKRRDGTGGEAIRLDVPTLVPNVRLEDKRAADRGAGRVLGEPTGVLVLDCDERDADYDRDREEIRSCPHILYSAPSVGRTVAEARGDLAHAKRKGWWCLVRYETEAEVTSKNFKSLGEWIIGRIPVLDRHAARESIEMSRTRMLPTGLSADLVYRNDGATAIVVPADVTKRKSSAAAQAEAAASARVEGAALPFAATGAELLRLIEGLDALPEGVRHNTLLQAIQQGVWFGFPLGHRLWARIGAVAEASGVDGEKYEEWRNKEVARLEEKYGRRLRHRWGSPENPYSDVVPAFHELSEVFRTEFGVERVFTDTDTESVVLQYAVDDTDAAFPVRMDYLDGPMVKRIHHLLLEDWCWQQTPKGRFARRARLSRAWLEDTLEAWAAPVRRSAFLEWHDANHIAKGFARRGAGGQIEYELDRLESFVDVVKSLYELRAESAAGNQPEVVNATLMDVFAGPYYRALLPELLKKDPGVAVTGADRDLFIYSAFQSGGKDLLVKAMAWNLKEDRALTSVSSVQRRWFRSGQKPGRFVDERDRGLRNVGARWLFFPEQEAMGPADISWWKETTTDENVQVRRMRENNPTDIENSSTRVFACNEPKAAPYDESGFRRVSYLEFMMPDPARWETPEAAGADRARVLREKRLAMTAHAMAMIRCGAWTPAEDPELRAAREAVAAHNADRPAYRDLLEHDYVRLGTYIPRNKLYRFLEVGTRNKAALATVKQVMRKAHTLRPVFRSEHERAKGQPLYVLRSAEEGVTPLDWLVNDPTSKGFEPPGEAASRDNEAWVGDEDDV